MRFYCFIRVITSQLGLIDYIIRLRIGYRCDEQSLYINNLNVSSIMI